MKSELPASVLALPVHRISLHSLPSGTRDRLTPKIRHGRIRTIGDLVAELEPSHVQNLSAALSALAAVQPAPLIPPHVEDLLDVMVVDLIRSVGLPSTAASLSWVTPRQVLFRTVQRVSDTDYQRVGQALALRSERRVSAIAFEEQREPLRAMRPAGPLVPFWSELREGRVHFRKTITPEDEYDRLTRGEVEADPPVVCVSSADGSRWVRIPLPEEGAEGMAVEAHGDRRWVLGAIDRVLDWIADPSSEVHAALLALLGRPAWDRDLHRLDSLIDELGAPEVHQVGWRVVDQNGGPTFRPVRCTPKKKGGWTTKNVAWAEVRPVDLLDERVASLLRRWRTAPPEISALAAEALIGHPRVFAPGSGGPIRVRRVTLALAFVREDGGVRPVIEVDGVPISVYELSGQLYADAADTWLRLLPGELQVVNIRPQVATVLSGWLSRAGVIADDGVGALLARIPALSPLVPIRIDPALRGGEVEADPRPVLRVTWDGATLAIEARVRPLPELPPTPPGEGLGELVTMRSGSPCFVRRDLEAEPARMLEALAPLSLHEGEREGWRWVVTDADRAVDVLLALAEAGGAFRTEWEGPAPSVGRIEAKGLRVRVGSGRDWFDVSGTFEGEQGAIDLSDLLAALREGRSFLQVRPNVFVRIAEQLRGALRAVAAAEDGGRIAPLQAPILDALADAGVAVEGSEEFQASVERIRSAAAYVADVPAGLVGVLRDYQVEGFRWLARLATWAPGAVLADDMGLGKTVQAIALLTHRPGPALVVCPLSVLANWEAELARFAPDLTVTSFRGSGRSRRLEELGPRSVVLTSWDLLARDPALAEIAWGTAVFDEAQAIKNAHTARSKGARALRAGFVVALTGTPVENRSEELWSLFRAVAPGLLGSEKRFGERFAGPIDRAEPGARDVLARLVRPFVLRRTKTEVAPELPSRTEVVVKVPLSADERALYEATRLEAIARASAAEGPGQRFEVLRWLTRLRQLACHPRLVDPGSPIASSKLAQLRRRVADLRDTGHKALVFSQFVSHLELVRDVLLADGVRVRWLTGQVDEVQRRREVAAFQAGDGDVFLISLGAGGTGLNLTAADYVFHLDPWWNPAKEDQASDRAHRIGQTRPVTVYRLVAEGTIEEQILSLHEQKRDLADALLAGADGAARVGTEELLELLSDAVGAGLPPVPAQLPDRPVPPVVPEAPSPALAEPAVILAAFRASLDAELASGKLKNRSTVRSYERSVENLFAWAGPPADRAALAENAERYLRELGLGKIPHASDKVFAKPAFSRLLAMLS